MLEFTEGPRAGQKLILRKTRATLGRAEEADVFLDGAEISRQHAEIELRNNRAYLLDLRTTEGVENPLILFGIYDDLYRKVDDAWKIHRTRIDFLWPRRQYLGPRQI